jgi:lycopene cyclase domain-containing protein
MTYTWFAVLGLVLAVAIDVVVLRTRLLCHKTFWTAYAIIVCFQLIVNGILTGLPVVRYDGARIIGWRIAYAPVEDLLFGFALVTITLSLWVFAGRPAEHPEGQR